MANNLVSRSISGLKPRVGNGADHETCPGTAIFATIEVAKKCAVPGRY